MDLSESNFSRKDIFKSHQEEENKRERNQPAQNWFTCPYLWGTRRIEGISLLYLHSLELQVFEFFHEKVRPPTTASLAATVLVHHYELTRSCWKLIVNFYSFLCFSVSLCVSLASCFLCLCQFANLTYSFAFAVATTLQIMMLLWKMIQMTYVLVSCAHNFQTLLLCYIFSFLFHSIWSTVSVCLAVAFSGRDASSSHAGTLNRNDAVAIHPSPVPQGSEVREALLFLSLSLR